MRLSSFREDLEKQQSGAPIFIGDACFFSKRWGTNESNKMLRDIRSALFGPFHKSHPDDDNRVFAEWLCWAVTGWENVLDEDGNPVPYSESAARNIFTNPEYYLSLNTQIISLAMNFELYLHEETKEDQEALKKP